MDTNCQILSKQRMIFVRYVYLTKLHSFM